MSDAEYPCHGDCNRDFRKAETDAAPFGGHHDVDFVSGQPIWCPLCRDLIEQDLAHLAGLARQVAPGKLNTPRETSTGDSKRTKAASYPSLSPGWDSADAVICWAVNLEDTTRARLGHGDPKPGRRLLADAIRYLQAWSTAILSDEDTGQLVGGQIRSHKRALVRVTGTDRPVHRIKGECPACGARGRISRKDGDDLVRCACGAHWTSDHFQYFAKVITDTERARCVNSPEPASSRRSARATSSSQSPRRLTISVSRPELSGPGCNAAPCRRRWRPAPGVSSRPTCPRCSS